MKRLHEITGTEFLYTESICFFLYKIIVYFLFYYYVIIKTRNLYKRNIWLISETFKKSFVIHFYFEKVTYRIVSL